MSLVTAAAAVAASMAIVSPVASSPAATTPNPSAFVLERFQPASQAQQAGAVTYDKRLVPTTAAVVVAELRFPHGMHDHHEMYHHGEEHDHGEGHDHGGRDHEKYRGTYVFLALRGVAPHHHFGIHVHTKPCGTKPDSSGPHYQNAKDPKQPSVNPTYANPRNEVWLDLTTNGSGDGRSQSFVKWHFRPGEARSVVIHEHATSTKAGKAGMAGDRVACINVPFK